MSRTSPHAQSVPLALVTSSKPTWFREWEGKEGESGKKRRKTDEVGETFFDACHYGRRGEKLRWLCVVNTLYKDYAFFARFPAQTIECST